MSDVTPNGESAAQEIPRKRRRLNDGRYPQATGYARWMLWFQGRPYRLVMRYMHRHGWCYPSRSGVQPNMVWCHWCGMRGRAVLLDKAEFDAAVAEMTATTADRTPE